MLPRGLMQLTFGKYQQSVDVDVLPLGLRQITIGKCSFVRRPGRQYVFAFPAWIYTAGFSHDD